jgi:hypothetical protein
MHVHEEFIPRPPGREAPRRAPAQARPSLLTRDEVVRLQRLAGNAAVASVLRPDRRVLPVQRDGPDAGPPADAGPANAAAPGTCAPTSLSRQAFLQQPGVTTTEFGLTTLDTSQVTFPDVRLDGRRLQPTSAALPVINSVCVGSGVFLDPQDVIRVVGQAGSGCPTGDYPRRWNITGPGADRIRAGEQEHCDDFHCAFDISLRRFADAVNRMAAAGRRFGSEAAAKRALRQSTGVAPDDWQLVFLCLAGKTRLRDGRANSWHTPHTRHLDPYPHCRYVETIVDGTSLPHVGAHPPASIIRGCGEGPAGAVPGGGH